MHSLLCGADLVRAQVRCARAGLGISLGASGRLKEEPRLLKSDPPTRSAIFVYAAASLSVSASSTGPSMPTARRIALSGLLPVSKTPT